MASDVHQPDAFIAYPTNRVVGTIVDPKHAQAAIEALLQVGFARQDIDILHGEEDLHRPDPTGAEHRFLAQFQRTLIRTLADEHQHLRHYVEDVRAGRWVIMVLAKKRDQREAAADILGTHGAAIHRVLRQMGMALAGAAPGGASRRLASRSHAWPDVRDRSRWNGNTCTDGLGVQGDDPSQVRWFSEISPAYRSRISNPNC